MLSTEGRGVGLCWKKSKPEGSKGGRVPPTLTVGPVRSISDVGFALTEGRIRTYAKVNFRLTAQSRCIFGGGWKPRKGGK